MRKLYIEPTSICNLECEICFRNSWFDEKFCDLPYAVFEKIMDELPQSVQNILFGGMGETFYHKDIFKMIEKSKEKVEFVEIITNATLLDRECIEKIIDIKLDRIWVSVDALTDNGADNSGHNSFKSVEDMFVIFNRIKENKKSDIELCMTYVASKDNVHELENLPFFIKKNMISKVNISNVYPLDEDGYKSALYKKTLNLSTGSDKYSTLLPTVNMPYMDFDEPQVKRGVNGMFPL